MKQLEFSKIEYLESIKIMLCVEIIELCHEVF